MSVIRVTEEVEINFRDYIATEALNGMISNPHWFGSTTWVSQEALCKQYAEEAYVLADAMLEARLK